MVSTSREGSRSSVEAPMPSATVAFTDAVNDGGVSGGNDLVSRRG
ncbi:hypothetical protein [Haladaptatus sp. AB618]|nr:hypothetical protein [Haladaptatus sp. AB618]